MHLYLGTFVSKYFEKVTKFPTHLLSLIAHCYTNFIGGRGFRVLHLGPDQTGSGYGLARVSPGQYPVRTGFSMAKTWTGPDL
jgi:hypothetical protein